MGGFAAPPISAPLPARPKPPNRTATVKARTASVFQDLWTWANTAAAQYQSVAILLDGQAYDARTVFIPKTPEVFTYDADGNLLSDGRWDYTWNGENQLVAMQTRYGLPSSVPVNRLEFSYDYLGRRVQKRVYQPTGAPAQTDSAKGADAGSGGLTGKVQTDAAAPGNVAPYGWTNIANTQFVWDGWNLIGEFNTSWATLHTYCWGLDLSGSEQGAGGIGGLVFQTDGVGNVYHALYDGNGNLTRLKDSAGAMAADYEYGPFGEVLIARGDYVLNNPVRFSTKYADAETGLLYYGYRYYNAGTGRWLSRDPAAEDCGGVTLYVIDTNNPVCAADPLGLWSRPVHQAIVDAWLPASRYENYKWHCDTIPVIQLIKDGSDYVDGTGKYIAGFLAAQSSSNAYQHAMRAPNQSTADAQRLYRTFVSDHIREAYKDANAARAGGKGYMEPVDAMDDAVFELGKAYHAISDSLSPAHRGFQVWYGPIDGPAAMTPEGEAITYGIELYRQFIREHEARETRAVYDGMATHVNDAIKAELQSKLDSVLRE